MPIVIPVAAAVATLAAIVDVRRRRIPNWLTFGALALGLILNVWQTGPAGGAIALLGALLGLSILLPLYLIRALGAGDVKLLAALGALLGPQTLMWVVPFAAIVGGLMSAVVLARSGRLGSTLSEIFVLRQLPSRSGLTTPYGVAIAGGVFLSMLVPGVA